MDGLPHVADPVELDVDLDQGEGRNGAMGDAINDEASDSTHHLNLRASDVNFHLHEDVHSNFLERKRSVVTLLINGTLSKYLHKCFYISGLVAHANDAI